MITDTIDKSLDLPLDHEQATEFFGEHDLHDVLNKLPQEAFDIFTGASHTAIVFLPLLSFYKHLVCFVGKREQRKVLRLRCWGANCLTLDCVGTGWVWVKALVLPS